MRKGDTEPLSRKLPDDLPPDRLADERGVDWWFILPGLPGLPGEGGVRFRAIGSEKTYSLSEIAALALAQQSAESAA